MNETGHGSGFKRHEQGKGITHLGHPGVTEPRRQNKNGGTAKQAYITSDDDTGSNHDRHKYFEDDDTTRTMTTTFGQELFHGAPIRGRKQEIPRIRVIKVDFAFGGFGITHKSGLFEVTTVYNLHKEQHR